MPRDSQGNGGETSLLFSVSKGDWIFHEKVANLIQRKDSGHFRMFQRRWNVNIGERNIGVFHFVEF
jgi:hypothetical protein